MRSNTVLVTLAGRFKPLDTEDFNLDAVSPAHLSLNGVEHLRFNFVKSQFGLVGGDQIAEGGLADDTAFGVRTTGSSVCSALVMSPLKLSRKHPGIGDTPADIDRDDQTDLIFGERLVELALEGLDAIVELVDFLDGPWQTELESGVGDASRVLAKRSDYRHFRLAHLKSEQHADENNGQHSAGDDRDRISFHKRRLKFICSSGTIY